MRKLSCLFALLVLCLGVTSALKAQTATGQITGTVKDASGAVLARAKVTVTNQSTNFTRETNTSDDGTYVFPLLPIVPSMTTRRSCAAVMAFSMIPQKAVKLTALRTSSRT